MRDERPSFAPDWVTTRHGHAPFEEVAPITGDALYSLVKDGVRYRFLVPNPDAIERQRGRFLRAVA